MSNKCHLCNYSIEINQNLQKLYDELKKEFKYLRSLKINEAEFIRKLTWELDQKPKRFDENWRSQQYFHYHPFLDVYNLNIDIYLCEDTSSVLFCKECQGEYTRYINELKDIREKINKIIYPFCEKKLDIGSKLEQNINILMMSFMDHFLNKVDFILPKMEKLKYKVYKEKMLDNDYDFFNLAEYDSQVKDSKRINHNLDHFREFSQLKEHPINPSDFIRLLPEKEHEMILSNDMEIFGDIRKKTNNYFALEGISGFGGDRYLFVSRYGYFWTAAGHLSETFYTDRRKCEKEINNFWDKNQDKLLK